MTLEPAEALHLLQTIDHLGAPCSQSSQHGSLPRDPSGLHQDPPGGPGDETAHARDSAPRGSGGGVDADVLDERLRGLSSRGLDGPVPAFPGQRVFEYENAVALQTAGEAVVCDLPSGGIQLSDLPNEILTHIFSHLPPDCHSSMALVSRRFYALISTHHVWHMAFLRHFPGHTALAPGPHGSESGREHATSSHIVRSETRYFPRLLPNATWRSEYLLRTRYLRSLARGKPGMPLRAGDSGRLRSGKKSDAVLTFCSHLSWRITSIDAAFSNGSRPPRMIQGCGELGSASIVDPTTGKIEKWCQEQPASQLLADLAPGVPRYGLGEGPALVPNVVDVSQHYGLLVGEGFSWGSVYFCDVNERNRRYLNQEAIMAEDSPDIPSVRTGLDVTCSVWIAKSPAVVSATHLMCGMLTGSSLGLITAYSLRNGTAGSKQTSGEVTARWAVCPGVPIISLKVDGSYCETRRAANRVWAVALNALGEVYYLTEVPSGKPVLGAPQIAMMNAWRAGRTVCWKLLEDTRRVAKADVGDDLLHRRHSPWGSLDQQRLDRESLLAEVELIDQFLQASPAHFRRVFHGWDMRRRLEVDFAGDDGRGAGESVFVADCGLAEDVPACIRRYTRSSSLQRTQTGPLLPLSAPPTPSLFGAALGGVAARGPRAMVEPQSPRSPPPTPKSPAVPAGPHDWICQELDLKHREHSVITALALDNSTPSLLTGAEEASLVRGAHEAPRNASLSANDSTRDVPGCRARFLVAGTSDGTVLTWNAREDGGKAGRGRLQPIRIIKTDSPAVTYVAASALYIVHGGSDGLVQAWDPLCSDPGPLRTICAKTHGRAPRIMVWQNHRLQEEDLSAVGCIYLDPNPVLLQGVVAYGNLLRAWSYSAAGRLSRHHKPRSHRPEPDAHLVSRRQAGLFADHIATEEAELRREEELRASDRSYLRKRFGALGDLTEDEALVYAQMISEEAFLAQEQERARHAATLDASIEDATSSSWYTETGSDATCTPDPSIAGPSKPGAHARAQVPESAAHAADEDYEQQIQRAIRLSLMESGGDALPSPQASGSSLSLSPEAEYSVKHKGKGPAKHPETTRLDYQYYAAAGSSNEDEDLMLALSLSMQDQQHAHAEDMDYGGVQEGGEEFPSLPADSAGKGKGKGVRR